MSLTPGWQQPPVPPKPRQCPHLGLVFAVLTLPVHDTGHEWVCGCGTRFVVVSNGPGGPKKFEERKR